MKILVDILLSGLAVFVTALILPGVHVDGFLIAVAVAVILALVNAFVRPLVFFLTLPITVLTLGLFTFIITGFMVLLVDWLISGFEVNNILWAILFAFIVSLISSFLRSLARLSR